MADFLVELKKKLEKFKSWIDAPRLYISTELDTLKNEVDVETEKLLLKINKCKTKSDAQKNVDCDKVNANRKQMIDKVDAFQTKIFSTLTTNELEANFVTKLVKSIQKHETHLRKLETKKTALEEDLSNVEYAVDSLIQEFNSKITDNSSLLFVTKTEFKHCLGMENEVNETFDKSHNAYQSIYSSNENCSDDDDAESEETGGTDDESFDYDDDDFYEQETAKDLYKIDMATTFGFLYDLNDYVSKEMFKYDGIFYLIFFNRILRESAFIHLRVTSCKGEHI